MVQYIPLLYGSTAEVNSKTVRLLPASSGSASDAYGDEASLKSSLSETPGDVDEFLDDGLRQDRTRSDSLELFTTAGLYDQLMTRSLEGRSDV